MVYTIPYKGYIITLSNASVHVSLPKHLGGSTLLYVDAQRAATRCGTRSELSIDKVYKMIDAKIEELAKEKIDSAIKANQSSKMNALFIGEDGSMGFCKGKEYVLNIRLSPVRGYVISDSNRALTSCPYDSVEAIVRNWTIL